MSAPPAAEEAQVILVPREIVNADSVFVVSWTVPEGGLVEAGAAVCDIETSKAVVSVEAPGHGHVRHCADAGAEVAVGGILGYVTPRSDTPLPRPAAGPAPESGSEGGAARISAKARRKIDELGLDPSLFAGRALVRERDVIEMAAKRPAAELKAGEAAVNDPRGPFHLQALGPIQRRVARVMEQSVAAIPAAYLERTIDLAVARQRARALAAESKIVVTEVDLLVAAVAQACVQLPRFNSFVTAADDLHLFDRVSVGVAVDTDGDLYVVVVKNAADKTPAAIAKELRGLQYLAQRRRLGVEHLSGGTITVTSMLGRGIHRFQPIPYPQQAAIVGIADPEPGSSRAALGLVFDHRVANGSEAAAFLAAIDAALGGGG